MDYIISTEDKLKERIKELTCLYNVSSYIAISDVNDLEPTFNAIAFSLKEATRHNQEAFVEIDIENNLYQVGKSSNDNVFIVAVINEFNIPKGAIKIGYSTTKFAENVFLEEEKQLLNLVALEMGNLLERKQSIENEILAKRRIERADRLTILGEITAGIAHELNTPLANILGFSELLKEQFKENDAATNDLSKIINSAVYSREVVKKLMFFSCDMPQQIIMTNIVPVIQEAIDLLMPNVSKKNLRIDMQIEEEEIFLKVDSIQLTQVIFNLIMNANYFSPQDGLIKVVINNLPQTVVIKITDQGFGIPSDKADHIFNPFFTSKPVGEGSGLGLSVVHGIVKSHRGSIKHEPNIPKGTIFTVTFPKN